MKPGRNKKEDGPKDQLSKSMKVGKSELQDFQDRNRLFYKNLKAGQKCFVVSKTWFEKWYRHVENPSEVQATPGRLRAKR